MSSELDPGSIFFMLTMLYIKLQVENDRKRAVQLSHP